MLWQVIFFEELCIESKRMSSTEPVLLSALIASGSSIVLAIISRLRFRCFPNEQGRCTCLSGCSEVPLTNNDDAIDAHEYDLNGQKVLLVTSKADKA